MPDVTAPFGFPYPEDTDLVRDGAADIEALAEGVNDQLALGFVFVGTRYYTSSGTFAKADPFGDSSFDGAKLRAIKVRVIGAGGGGGGVALTGAGASAGSTGGSGGGFAESLIDDIAGLATTVTVTRGAGGNGGVGAASGSAGGSSSFGAVVAAEGGGSGFGGAAVSTFPSFTDANQGGPGTAGDIIGQGFGAGVVSLGATSPLALAGGQSLGSSGGSIIGGGLRPAVNANGATGGIGAGGSGVFHSQSQATARNGGNGGNGIVIVDVFA